MAQDEQLKKRKLADVALANGAADEQSDEAACIDKDRESIARLLQPFSREQLVEILTSAYVLLDIH